jgi:hypothetical protein
MRIQRHHFNRLEKQLSKAFVNTLGKGGGEESWAERILGGLDGRRRSEFVPRDRMEAQTAASESYSRGVGRLLLIDKLHGG